MQEQKTNQEILTDLNLRLKSSDIEKKLSSVKDIINQVKLNGDRALAYYCEKFDQHIVDLNLPQPFTIQIDLEKKPNFKN